MNDLTLRQRGKKWWIVGIPINAALLAADDDNPDVPGNEIGPYDTKADALQDCIGLRRFYHEQHRESAANRR